MTVDLRSKPWSASFTILDADRNAIGPAYDLSEAIAVVEITFAELNLEGPNGLRPWTGRLILEDGITPQSIDARNVSASPTGASLLAPGNAIDLQLFIDGSFQRFWPTLYILRVPSPFDPLSSGDRNTTIELGDITLLDAGTGQPEGNLSGMSLGTIYTRSEIANNILSARGLPPSPDTISSYPLSVPTQKLRTNAWTNEIGRLVGTAGYQCWVDRNDDIRFTPITLDKSAPDFALVIGQDDEKWDRANIAERPTVKLIVLGTGGRAIERSNPETITTVGPEKETTFTRTISTGFNKVTEVYEERLSERIILPRIPTQSTVDDLTTVDDYTENTSTSLRLARRETVVKDYSFSGELQVCESTIEMARGIAQGDAFRDTDDISDAYDLLTIEESTITYDYRRGRLSDRETRVKRPWAVVRWANVRPNNYEENRFLSQTNFIKTESWRRRGLTSQSWEYECQTRRPQGELPTYYGAALNAEVLRIDPGETDTIESDENGPAVPPSTEFMPQLYDQDDRQYSGSVEIVPLAGQAHKNREQTIAIQGPYVVSNGQCSALARIIGRLEHGLSLGEQFSGQIPPWLISSFEPGARVDVADDGLIKSYFLNGFTIAGDNTETVWGCTLVELGTVGATPDVVAPPVTLSLAPVTAAGGGVDGAFAIVDNVVSLRAVGGGIDGALAIVSDVIAQACWDSLTAGEWDQLSPTQWDGLASSDCVGGGGQVLDWDGLAAAQWDGLTASEWDGL